MPLVPDWFKLIPEFVLNAPRFMRRLINNEYEDWISNELWGINVDGPPLPRELGTFSDDIANSARRVTGYLRYLGEHVHASEYLPGRDDRFVINLYSRNSLPFHAITRGMGLLQQYEDMDPSLVREYFPNTTIGLQTVNNLNNVLRQVPILLASEYDVSWWTQGYTGQMVFRGALTLPNPDPNIPSTYHGAIYNFNQQLVGDRIINTGDIVTNTDFMSTSAHPSVASEFVIRQALSWPGNNTPTISTDTHYRRVMFRIDMWSGRNVCPWTNLEQAEILFPLLSLFRVVDISVSDYGLLVQLVELTSAEAGNVTAAKNIFTGANVSIPKSIS
ncbi:TPA: hypothetical protein RRU80_005366 [Klebsiella variicola]|nr:hypothetical protein [Klebsiella variicola]